MQTTWIITGAIVMVIMIFIIWRFITSPKKHKEYYSTDGEKRISKIYYTSYDKTTAQDVKKGKEQIFYPTGELNKVSYWENGKRNGKCTIYYRSGKVYIECNYKDDQIIGNYLVRDEKGQIIYSK